MLDALATLLGLPVLPVVLPTDLVVAAVTAALLLYARAAAKRPHMKARWQRVLARPSASAALVLLASFLAVALVDSVHYRAALPPVAGAEAPAWSPVTRSLLDDLVHEGLGAAGRERSYSAPFAELEFDKSTVVTPAGPVRDFQPLKSIGRTTDGRTTSTDTLLGLGLAGLAGGLASGTILLLLLEMRRGSGAAPNEASSANAARPAGALRRLMRRLARPRTGAPRWTWLLVCATVGIVLALWPERHLFGTDAVGTDVLYEALKSIRTAIVIGTLATFSALPFAVVLGLAAGYFRGWVDEVVQYVYTTLSAIPSVLLIAASVLMATVFMDRHPDFWPTGLERADAKLFMLAVIIGATGWATLARLLRAEAMRIRELEYVRAARALGVPPLKILARHVLPNVLHIILIVAVLDFSGIVLYEAVLSYVGVGVDPSLNSFGTMINAARSEMSRSPMVWWNLAASFAFLLVLVLSANLFAAAVRDAFDPRASMPTEAEKDEEPRPAPNARATETAP